MVNEERLSHMIKIARFDTYDDKTCKPMAQYARRDYVSLQMLKSFITGSLVYALIFGMWCLYYMQELMKELNKIDLQASAITLGVSYAVWIVFYEAVTYIVYQLRYTKGRRKIKSYYASLKKVNQMYEREEKLKIPEEKAWDS